MPGSVAMGWREFPRLSQVWKEDGPEVKVGYQARFLAGNRRTRDMPCGSREPSELALQAVKTWPSWEVPGKVRLVGTAVLWSCVVPDIAQGGLQVCLGW